MPSMLIKCSSDWTEVEITDTAQWVLGKGITANTQQFFNGDSLSLQITPTLVGFGKKAYSDVWVYVKVFIDTGAETFLSVKSRKGAIGMAILDLYDDNNIQIDEHINLDGGEKSFRFPLTRRAREANLTEEDGVYGRSITNIATPRLIPR